MAKGKFIVRLDADDLLTTKFLESYSDLIKNEKYDFLYSDYFVIDADGNIVECAF